MNCSQVRSLFSARVDFELTGDQSREHDDHLKACSGCDREWRSFRTTVRMVRSLPVKAPSASFVGQVLDRIRAHEAQPVPAYLDPADFPLRDSAPPPSVGWPQRIRGFLDSLRSPAPAFAAGALALGFLGGFAALNFRSDSESASASNQRAWQRTLPVTQSFRGGSVGGDHAPNPFADLADEIRRLPEPSLDAGQGESFDLLPSASPFWSSDPSLQQYQVRASDVRPRITF